MKKIAFISIFLTFFYFLWYILTFHMIYYKKLKRKKIMFFCSILADLPVSDWVSGVQNTVTNAVCIKISIMFNKRAYKLSVLKAFASWMQQCITWVASWKRKKLRFLNGKNNILFTASSFCHLGTPLFEIRLTSLFWNQTCFRLNYGKNYLGKLYILDNLMNIF